ncbi:MAG: hypothetical protein IJM90_05330 [Firmicutes bacterium]|nr:hypothetical protein [Bacillota bacterium]
MPSPSKGPRTEEPKVYTSRYKKSERVLKAFFVLFYVILALWLVKILIYDSVRIQGNSYNPRLPEIEARFDRGSLLDRNGTEIACQDAKGVRVYPYGSVLGPVTGYSGSGKSGLEYAVNQDLLSAGSLWDSIAYWTTDRKLDGCDVVTTIDAKLSNYAWDLLGDYRGAVVLTEADTGRLLVMVSKPFYDPNTVLSQWDELIEEKGNLFFNRASQGLYAPGSTFKILTSLAWRRSAAYDADYRYTCDGYAYFNSYGLRCYGGAVHGTQSIASAFADSCNTFFSTLGVKIGAEDMIAVMESMGFGKAPELILPAEAARIGLKADSSEEDVAATAIGQGRTGMTPLMMNRITCAIACSGTVHDFSLVSEVLNRDKTVKKYYPPGNPQPLMSEDEAEWLKTLMSGVTDTGTAAGMSKALGLTCYGKTGTAENESGVDHSWFTGFITPDGSAPVAVTVLIEQAGGRIKAADLARQILARYLNPSA